MLMSYESDTAQRYRAHAEQLRAIAKADNLEETKRILTNVADDYDRMASALEAIDQTNRRVDERRGRTSH
jgi:hypothetical protein